MNTRSGRRQALVVVLSQFAIGAIVALACLAIADARAAKSAVLGAGTGVVATTLMAWAMLRPGMDASAGRAAIGLAVGWLAKVGMTIALLVLALRSQAVAAVPLIAGYAATYAGYWIGASWGAGPNTKRTFGVAD